MIKMIKNIKLKALILFIVLGTSTSCNKWLELKPQDGLVREDFWQTKEQLESTVIGAYSSLLNNSLVTNLFLWGELRADMIMPTPVTSIEEVNVTNGEIVPTNPLARWGTLYTTINYCNTIIEFGPTVMESDKTLTQTQLNAYLAEARGLRALMYFYLLRIWGEVPLQLKASSSDTKIEQLAKSSKEDVYNQIISDLTFAEANAVVTYGDINSNKGRITKYTVNAIQADVYLWGEEYNKCIGACDKIINSNNFGLVSTGNWFNNVFRFGNTNESIFEFQFHRQATNPWFNFFTGSVRRYQINPLVVIELYGQDALDPVNVKDRRADGYSFKNSDGSVWKYVGANENDAVKQEDSFRHWQVYRYADILLLKAEALAWVERGQEALDLVDLIRARAEALPESAMSVDPGQPLEVSEYILNERAREFAFEGKRWFDLLRNAKRNDYAHNEILTDVISEIAPPDRKILMIGKYSDPRFHYMPIHIEELQADKLLEQNPFYK